MESKEGMGKYVENPLEWKTTSEQGKNVPYSLELSIMWKWKSLYRGDILPKESLFSTSLSYTKFLLFLLFFPRFLP